MHDVRRTSGSGIDDQLIMAATAGDTIAYGRLVKLYQSPIRGFLRQLTRQDFALADDLAQDTFMQALKHIDSFRHDASFKSWLTSIAYKIFLQYIRKDKRRSALMQEAVAEQDETVASTDDNRLDIERALARLKLEERTAITLHYHQGMSHIEVAAVMQMPLGTIKSHIGRGRENLKSLLTSKGTRRTP